MANEVGPSRESDTRVGLKEATATRGGLSGRSRNSEVGVVRDRQGKAREGPSVRSRDNESKMHNESDAAATMRVVAAVKIGVG